MGYTRSPEGNILFNAQSIDNVFCINLESSNDRREYLSDLPFIDFVSAIDSRTNPAVYKYFGLEFKPVNNSHDLYFKRSSGAAGVYLSHMSIWKKMVDEDISRALIIEDDIDKDDLLDLFTSNIIFEPFDFVNLSFRFRWSGHRTLYDGAEAYILTIYNNYHK